MKKALTFLLSFACLATVSQAEWIGEGTQSLRLDYVYADDVGTESADGVEIAFGTAMYELDDVAVYFLHQENSDMEAQQLGISIQEHFPITGWSIDLIPYAGAGAGYGWSDFDGYGGSADVDNGGFVCRVELGAILKVCDVFAFNAGARLNLSTHDIFLDGDESAEDTQWTFAFGGRFYY